ncbi:MAG: hypothetical protein KIT22_15395, partial [Verrucomicrobiae bacterium]|nr:hypothetical protein [Verrucomicrobiae bacterium]
MNDSLSQFAQDLREDIRTMPPRDSAVAEAWFGAQAWRLCALQAASNPVYRDLCGAEALAAGFGGDWRGIPAVPSAAFKEWEATSLPKSERVRVFCSSGTTGHIPSRHYHSEESLAVYEDSLWAWFYPHLAAGMEPGALRFVSLTPSPDDAPRSSLAHMMDTVARRWRPS